MKNLFALINTKSNFRNLNGKWLKVHEFLGTIVCCIDSDDCRIDFSLSEIKAIRDGGKPTIGTFKILD